MTEFVSSISIAWAATSNLEIVSVIFGLVYIVLAAKENAWCWPAAFIGTGTAVILFWDASLLMESGLNVYYLGMAIFGWWQWQTGGTNGSPLTIRSWSLRQHGLALVLIGVLTLISGSLLSSNTSAALPYLDSFTTWSAVITTWMVARKILENWLYWLVINTVSIYLYLERGLSLYALLFVSYIIIAAFGYVAWRRTYLSAQVRDEHNFAN